jgi:uncharacterized protein YjbJ (UPF0337 family)
MNWDQIEGKWKQMKGSMKQKWGQLTDSDFEQIAGSRDKFIGRLQERYGYTREQADKELSQWMTSQQHEHSQPGTTEKPQVKTGGSGR